MPRRDPAAPWLPGVEWTGAARAPEPADIAERRRALDTETSFIVQAPAGSGKTELLIQRYLALLARVAQPEAIAAITFTVKAAGEMRARVLDALGKAQGATEETSEHQRFTLELAREALARDAREGWRLVDNPDRLRIQTIDALSMGITRQMPWLARFGAMPDVVEDARGWYRQAAGQAVEMLGGASGAVAAEAVERLLEHLDGDAARAISLLAAMLETRDHWLRVMGTRPDPAAVREQLETSLRRIIRESLARLQKAFPAACVSELVALARYAASNVDGSDEVISALAGLTALPEDIGGWLGIRKMLLTGDGEWRKRPDRRTGFPPGNRVMKERLSALVEGLRPVEEFRELLKHVPELPPPQYSEQQWQVLSVLFTLLPLTVAHLRTVFAEAGQVDFIEIAEAARHALGDVEHPTDLALTLGSRIDHLLVDEFQDTSLTQFELLRTLTAGWEDDRGRTLFLVGDPVQSIYRFRQAEVGLFLNVRESGIGTLRPTPLALSVNFRSARKLVEWVNDAFRDVFPAEADANSGAVPYTASIAFREGTEGAGVSVHPFVRRDDGAEADLVIHIIERARRESPAGRTAILVRARTHLAAIADRLRAAQVPYRAIEIQALAEKPVIQDLLALTRALLHLGDRVAWLAVLRAPWCGLTLADLHRIAGKDREKPVWTLLHDPSLALDVDGARRLAHVIPTLAHAVGMRGSVAVAPLVERTWIALGGDGMVESTELADARAYFDLLEETGAAGDVDDFEALSDRVRELFANPDADADGGVELMTIHKAKGLEFDTVILPGLGKPPKVDAPSLLAWSERPASVGADLLMAPISARRNGGDNRIYDFIRRESDAKGRHESQRLLYVACTRAKSRLHLIGHVEARVEGDEWVLRDPPHDSLLAHIWGTLRPSFEEELKKAEPAAGAPAVVERVPRLLSRVRLGLLASDPLPEPEQTSSEAAQVRLGDEHGDVSRHVGTVVHRLLDRIARDGIDQWNVERVASLGPRLRALLAAEGVVAADLESASNRVQAAIQGTFEDPVGRWILGPHDGARSEFAVSGVFDGEVRHLVIDRTFLAADGVRWIVDFKTSEPESGDLEGFLESEKREYQAQLRRYAMVLAELEGRTIRTGLYFPMIGKWVDWDPS